MNTQKIQRKANNGITLIALVITIIVLLILAGVATATLTGENGILKQAQSAKAKTIKAGAKEQAQIAVMGSYDSEGKLDYKKLKESLENIGVTAIPDEKTFPLTITIDGENVEIKEDGTVKIAFNAEEWDKTACKESSFLWESDDPDSGEAYHTIIGYADSITNEVKLKIPSRCHEIQSIPSNFDSPGRTFVRKNINTVELPDTLTKIGDYAFANFNFETIMIPDSVVAIGHYALGGTDLTTITIPDSITSIGDQAFFGCENLTTITIPTSITSIGNATFAHCRNLSEIIIPDSVINIGESAFEACTNLKTITIPNSVISIGSSAFSECSNLTKITLSNNMQVIEGWIFYNCTNLKNIIIPDSVTTINDDAFFSCTNLTNLVIPNKVIKMGRGVFYNWISSQTINIKGYSSTPSGWNNAWNEGCSATINWNQ